MIADKIRSVLIIGMGLIGSSIARAITEKKLAENIFAVDPKQEVVNKCIELNLVKEIKKNLDEYNQQFDLIFICTPLSKYNDIFFNLNKYVNQNTLLTDVGSTKISVIADFKANVKNDFIKFLPCHPIAGLEKSGPEYGFSTLFENRYCIATPFNKDDDFVKVICKFWEEIGMKIEIMDADYHDRILAMTSHIPQLIAYSVVGTVSELDDQVKDEIIKYSAAGFRDFTRLAGSDPIMWRDVYARNKDSVLEMLGRFGEDLSLLQKAIRNNDKDFLEKKFSNAKKIRKSIEDIGQAGSFDPRENK